MYNFRVGVLGATGAVGQKFIRLLENHPWFTVHAVGASERSAGKLYRDAIQWNEPTPLPEAVAKQKVLSCEPDVFNGVDFVFSGLDAAFAASIERSFAESGIPVISNAKNYRMHEQVPLLVPEVNPEHITLIDHQTFTSDGSGWIVTNPNCVVIPLVMSLKPLHDAYGIASALVTSMQAISGAGYPGVPSMDILGNVIPFIGGEEDKIETEPHKLLGTINNDRIEFANFPIQATATRVPVRNGHLLSVTIALHEGPEDISEAEELLRTWESPLKGLNLPTAPDKPLFLHDEERYPQPLLHADAERGMRAAIGRVRKASVLDLSYVAMAHNTIRGAAGGAILNAELLASKGYLKES
ncbi:MAG: aspartate-semialdehyde dehydrogenase [Balneolaceae bacterium]